MERRTKHQTKCDGFKTAVVTEPNKHFLLARFEELCMEWFRGKLLPVEKTIRDAKIDKSQNDDKELVGGSTRILKIQQVLQGFFNGKELDKRINPNKDVPYGPALQVVFVMSSGCSSDFALCIILRVPQFEY